MGTGMVAHVQRGHGRGEDVPVRDALFLMRRQRGDDHHRLVRQARPLVVDITPADLGIAIDADDPVALTINPTVTGMTVPEMLPAKFIASARNPAFRVAPIKVQAARDVKARAGLRGAGETKQQ